MLYCSQKSEELLPQWLHWHVDIKGIISYQLLQPRNSLSLEESPVFSKNHLQASPHNGLNNLLV